MKRYYFDYAASTPVDPAVVRVMTPFWAEKFGNPGSLHSFGQEASAGVFEARDKIARSLGCHYSEIVFTGSATEANNLALRGTVKSAEFRVQIPKIIVSAIEHDSVLDTAKDLEKNGAEVVFLPVLENGIVDIKKLESMLDERTVLVSVMFANNEIGTIQPIAKISEIIRNFRKGKKSETDYPLLHTDSVQAFNYLNCNVNDLGADLLTLSSQKIYGPKGIGLLYVKKNLKLSPGITGGGQERGFRSGTENVPGIIGFAKAVELADKMREKESVRLLALQYYFLKQLRKINSRIALNGDPKNRLPNNLNLHVPSRDGSKGSAQDLVIALDLAGFSVSPGSACSARVCSPSHVLKALGYSDEKAMSGLRVTFGRKTDKKQINALLVALKGQLIHML